MPSPIKSFEEAQLPQALAANTIRCNYTKPTPVQKYSIPIGLARRDLMACAQTGSGKTAAFCFPIIANILKSAQQPTGRSRKVKYLIQACLSGCPSKRSCTCTSVACLLWSLVIAVF